MGEPCTVEGCSMSIKSDPRMRVRSMRWKLLTPEEFNAPDPECPGKVNGARCNFKPVTFTFKTEFAKPEFDTRRRLAHQPHDHRLVVLEKPLEEIKRLNNM